MFDAQAPAAYSPRTALPSSRSTSPSIETLSPPIVNPEYIARPSDRSNAAHGPWSCAARYSGCLWKSGSSPAAAWVLYRSSVAARLPSGMPRASAISATVSQPSMNLISGISGICMCASSTIRYAVWSGCSRTNAEVREW